MSGAGFHDVVFPARLALGARGGPEFATDVITLASGREVRNTARASMRRRWEIGSAISDLAALSVLSEFFEARRGRLFGFRFRDPLDHASAAPGLQVSATDQMLGVGDGDQTAFKLVKRSGDVERRITKPVAGSVIVAVDGVEQASGWSVDPLTGQVVFDLPPSQDGVISAGFKFDCPVRFEEDRLEAVIEAFGAGRVVSLGLIELV